MMRNIRRISKTTSKSAVERRASKKNIENRIEMRIKFILEDKFECFI